MGRPKHTAGYYRIINQQIAWAKKTGLLLDRHHHVATLEANFFEPLHPETKAEYEAADGKELESKLFSVVSSAALVCNVFDHWRLADRAETLAQCCGVPYAVRQLCFEPAFKIFDGKKPARPDLALREDPYQRQDARGLTAIEAKFAEPYRRSEPSESVPFSDTYFSASSADIWDGLPETKKLAEAIRSRWESNTAHPLFEYLDATQLIKHAIGLNLAGKRNKRFVLKYLWYDLRDGDSAPADSLRHRSEIDFFRRSVADEFAFSDFTYQWLFEKLREVASEDEPYILYLANRYFDLSRPN